MNSSPSVLSKTGSVSTCGHTGTARDKCDFFSGSMSASLRKLQLGSLRNDLILQPRLELS